MRLAISNIAWNREEEESVLRLLRGDGVSGIEVAPTRYWSDWSMVNRGKAREVRSFLEGEGFLIPALQAILFGKPELNVFDPRRRADIHEHMKVVADLAADLGAGTAVFGSPKNRKRGPLGWGEAWSSAVELFYSIGRIFADRGVILGVEPVPREYGCDFLTNTRDAADFVRSVDSPGVGLHLDCGALALADGDIAAIIEGCPVPCHFHASEPNLGTFASPNNTHKVAARALAKMGYKGWISIEMKRGADVLHDIAEAVRFVGSTYAPAGQ